MSSPSPYTSIINPLKPSPYTFFIRRPATIVPSTPSDLVAEIAARRRGLPGPNPLFGKPVTSPHTGVQYRNLLTYGLAEGIPRVGGEAVFGGGPTLLPGAAGAAAIEAATARLTQAARAVLAARRGIRPTIPVPAPAPAAAPVARPTIRQTVVPGITARPAVAPQAPPPGVTVKPIQLAPGVEAEAVTGLGGQARRIVRTAIRQATSKEVTDAKDLLGTYNRLVNHPARVKGFDAVPKQAVRHYLELLRGAVAKYHPEGLHTLDLDISNYYVGKAGPGRGVLEEQLGHIHDEIFDRFKGLMGQSEEFLRSEAPQRLKELLEKLPPTLPTGTQPIGSVPFKAAKFGEQAGNVIEQTRPIITAAERAQRRGVLSDAAVDDLARMIGVTKNDLLRAAPGTTYNAENISAARQILKESADEVYEAAQTFVKNPKSAEAQGRFVDLLTQHGQVQVRVAGLASEAGRSLRQFRRVLQELPTVGEDIDRAIAALPSDIRAAAARVVRAGKDKAPQVLGELKQPTWKDMLVEFSTAAKISGPVTQLRNVAGNTVAALLRPVERGVAGVAESARALLTRTPRERLVGEAAADLFGRATALKDASRNFIRALASETPMLRETARIGEVGRVGAIPGRTGRIVRIPFRFLTAFDEFFREINRRGNVYAEAYRLAAKEGTPVAKMGERIAYWAQNLPKDAAERVSQETAEYLFQREMTQTGRTLLSLRNKSTVARILFPFFRTPVNLLTFVAERSPLGVAMPRNVAEFRAGGAQASEALARVAVGSMITASIGLRAKEGLITGAGPTDPRQRELLYAQGWQPYSVKIGGRWVSYRGFDPVASYLSNVSSAVETIRHADDWHEAAGKLAKEFTRNISNSTWLYGLQQIVEAMDDPEQYGGKLVGGFVTGMIPRVLDPLQKALDPYLREARGVIPQIQSRIPEMSRQLPPRLDVLGQPIRPEGGPLRGLLPSVSTPRPDPVLAELTRLGVNIPMPGRTVGRGREAERVAETTRRGVQAARGRMVQEQLRGLIASPEYQRLDDEAKRDVLVRWMLRIARAVPVRGTQ